MDNAEKMERLAAIGKHVKLIDDNYGYSQCFPELKESLEGVRAALAGRVRRIVED